MDFLSDLNASFREEEAHSVSFEEEFEEYCKENVINDDFIKKDDMNSMKECDLLYGDIMNYLEKNDSKYPRLSIFAKYFFSIPASSGEVERTFRNVAIQFP